MWCRGTSGRRGRHGGTGGARVGLTLIELLFVMAVLAIMIALVIGLGRHSDTVARINQARADLGEWSVALDRWYNIFGEYPRPPHDTNVVWLVSNRVEIVRYQEAPETTDYATFGLASNRFETSAIFYDLPERDPWRQYYRYEAMDNSADKREPLLEYRLFSAGPDGNEETAHDNIYFSN